MRDYREILINEFEQRQLNNRQYSLRAFARDLKLSPSRLSEILRGKQGLSRDRAKSVAKLLGYDNKGQTYFCDLVALQHARSALEKEQAHKRLENQNHLDNIRILRSEFQYISRWYDLALRRLTKVKGFQSDPKWIAHRLGITEIEVLNSLDRLKKSGTLSVKKGKFEAPDNIANKPDELPPVSRLEMIEVFKGYFQKALKAGIEQPLDRRDHALHFFGLNYKQIPKLKEMIREFEDKIDALTYETSEYDAVFCYGSQLFCIEENPPPFESPQTKQKKALIQKSKTK
ncbi:MAG: TIGR02147 family protein [Bdellovibrionales bacterium]|nr:TIGR02147 family protein [Bdellovibrionales bacterium]